MLDFLQFIFTRTEPRYGNELKKRVNFESIPLVQKKGDEIHEKIYCNKKEKCGGTKVKILMRKEAAWKLLSKCKNGGILEYKDLDQESLCVYSYNAKYE